jgi:ceramide glucosyltransferase
MSPHPFMGAIGTAALAAATAYAALTLVAALLWRLRVATRLSRRDSIAAIPPLTLLKPLCGDEPGLYANLRSFCEQDYPHYQIVFGVRDAADPALGVVARLQREFPHCPIEVVVNARQHGSNRKVSNLINMMARAQHELLLISDSDVQAGPGFLSAVASPLADPAVGLVTCLYHCAPTAGLWSRLGASYVNDWYMPSVLLSRLFGHRGYASGVALCLRRQTMRDIGGLSAIADHLADDYHLGELVSAQGKRIALAPYVAQVEHHEPSLQRLAGHELRWMRTVRALQPRCFPLLCVSFTVPMALLGAAITAITLPVSSLDLSLLVAAVTARVALACLPPLAGRVRRLRKLWLLPACDLLVCWAWCRALSTSRVSWRGAEFEVDQRGILRGHG